MNQHLCEYVDAAGDLLRSPEVRSMGLWRHHGSVTCLEHSLLVSYLSFRAADCLGLDARAAARAGLLHDLYLYDPRTKLAPVQCFVHPKVACRNAVKLTELSRKEQNIILSHMWPFGGALPRSREAWLVDLVDDISAGLEYSGFWKRMRLREKLGVKAPAPAPVR